MGLSSLVYQAGEDEAEAGEGPLPPKRLQKKISKRVKFLEKVATSSLTAKSSIKKKRRSVPPKYLRPSRMI
jgi:hypothetical protein